MINFTSIITAIRGASLAVKISLGIGATAIVAGGTVGAVVIINNVNNQNSNQQQIVAGNSDDEQPESIKDEVKEDETSEKADNNDEKQTANATQTESNANHTTQTTTSKPSNTSTSNPQTQTNNSTAAKPSASTTQPSGTSQPSQPAQPTQPVKKPDYNLNDRYVVGSFTMPFDEMNTETWECTVYEYKTFFGVVKYRGGGWIDLYTDSIWPQAQAYAEAKGYSGFASCGGMGGRNESWEDVVAAGYALDESKCAQYGLSCGRW